MGHRLRIFRRPCRALAGYVFVISTFDVPSLYADLLWDGGYHEFSEGVEGEIDMINGATADITGGYISILRCLDTSAVFVYEPSEISLLKPFDSSIANVYGGTINSLFTVEDSVTNIYEASLNFVDAVDSSRINMYVESYNWNPTGGTWGDGLLTGIWLNTSQPFSIEIIDLQTINHINFIPEPTTIILFGLGSIIFSRIS